MNYIRNQKGVSLIIIVFVMVLFAGLAWSLLSMHSGEFETNMRGFESERALYVAEAGAQWGVGQLMLDTSWRTSANTNCDQSSDWVLQDLNGGQARVCCRNPDIDESGEAVIEAEGYIPDFSSFLAKRKIKLTLSAGGLAMASQVRYLLDWSGAAAYSPLIYGDVGVRYAHTDNLHDGYEGNGNALHNQLEDVDPEPLTLRPPGSGRRDLLSDDSGFPIIDMAKIETEFAAGIYTPPRGGELTDIQTAGGKSTLTFEEDVFSAIPQAQFEGCVLRNTTEGSWQSGSVGIIEEVLSSNSCRLSGTVLWEDRDEDPDGKGDRICLIPRIINVTVVGPNWNSQKTYEITFDCNIPFIEGNVLRNFSSEARNARLNIWDYRDWGVITSVSTAVSSTIIRVEFDSSVSSEPGWQIADLTGEVKRFSGNHNNEVWFLRGDMLFDVRSGQSNCNESSFVAEGDIALIGKKSLSVKARNKQSGNPTLPNIATKNGSIFSYSERTANSRICQGILYSYNGDLTFDSLNASSAFGYNIIFTGYLNLNLNNPHGNWDRYVDEDGFVSGISSYVWSEEE